MLEFLKILEDLDDIQAFDEAKKVAEAPVPFDEFLQTLDFEN